MRKIILMPVSAGGFIVIIGTPAGPVAGADITCGLEPSSRRRSPSPPPGSAGTPIGRMSWMMNTSRDPVRAQQADRPPGTGRADYG